MKESPFLAAMKRIVGGIEIDHHLTGLPVESADTFSDQQGLDLPVVGLDLVGASLFVVAQLQPIERRGAGQSIASIVLTPRRSRPSESLLFAASAKSGSLRSVL